MCGGGTSVEAPQPSAEERALMAQQTQALQTQNQLLQWQQADAQWQRQQYQEQLYTQQQQQREMANNWNQYLQGPEVAAQKKLYEQQQSVTRQELDRYSKALEGKLPLSEGTIQAEADEREQFEEGMSRRLGSNWKNSTSGIQSLEAFDERWDLAKDNERRGYLQLGAQTALSRAGLAGQEQSAIHNQWMQGRGFEADLFNNMFNQFGAANQFGYGQGLSGLAGLQQGYANAAQPYQAYTQMQYNADAQNAQNNAAGMSGWGSAIGMGLGAMAMMSDSRLKREIVYI